MKKVIARLDPLSGPRFPFGQETKGIVKLIEKALHSDNIACISVSTAAQLLATDLWCQRQQYELVATDERGRAYDTIVQAHRAACDEYVMLDLMGIDHFSIDVNE